MRPETKKLIQEKLQGNFIHVRDIRSILKLETELIQKTADRRKERIKELEDKVLYLLDRGNQKTEMIREKNASINTLLEGLRNCGDMRNEDAKRIRELEEIIRNAYSCAEDAEDVTNTSLYVKDYLEQALKRLKNNGTKQRK